VLPTSVIIILREALEASLLISILAVVSGMLGFTRRWVFVGLGFGLLGAIVFSMGIGSISNWFDGVGQEVVSATLQGLIYMLFVSVAVLVLQHTRYPGNLNRSAPFIMGLAVALAVTREGFEALVYIYGFASVVPQFLTVILGTVIGTGIGISVGVLLYYFLRHPAVQHSPTIAIGLLALFGAGLMSQATQLLIQADWLPSQLPLWDTSGWLPEGSIAGQLLYVLIGYEATPTVIYVAVYLTALTILLAMAVLIGRSGSFAVKRADA